jgi:outer membrane protein OmpA-like peptidoglycan-associated protein
MNALRHSLVAAARNLVGLLAVTGLLAACAPTPRTPSAAAAVRAELTRLQSDATLAPLVPDAIRDAEAAVQVAEQPGASADIEEHRVYIAQRKVDIARALGEGRQAEQERVALAAERDRAQLEARTREVAAARSQAAMATAEADAARTVAASAQQQASDLQRQIDSMQARRTERGLVLTLGDVLFETGRAELKPGSVAKLDQLADFLKQYPERRVTIEGHTDNVGSEDSNIGLSQRRADAVRSYLMRMGVDPSRITSTGMGESMPVTTNETEAGRQQNRRVEIVISNPPVASG